MSPFHAFPPFSLKALNEIVHETRPEVTITKGDKFFHMHPYGTIYVKALRKMSIAQWLSEVEKILKLNLHV